jgi:hypothetical protein
MNFVDDSANSPLRRRLDIVTETGCPGPYSRTSRRAWEAGWALRLGGLPAAGGILSAGAFFGGGFGGGQVTRSRSKRTDASHRDNPHRRWPCPARHCRGSLNVGTRSSVDACRKSVHSTSWYRCRRVGGASDRCRQTSFLPAPVLHLLRSGVQVRLRRIKKGAGTLLKVRLHSRIIEYGANFGFTVATKYRVDHFCALMDPIAYYLPLIGKGRRSVYCAQATGAGLGSIHTWTPPVCKVFHFVIA